MALLNGVALALREYFVLKGYKWLELRWTRVILTVATLMIMLIPIVIWIVNPSDATSSIILSAIIGVVGHGVAYIVYRYKLPDMRSLTTTVLSGCVIMETIGFKIFSEIFRREDAIMFLIMTLITLIVFAFAIISLRKIAKNMEVEHG